MSDNVKEKYGLLVGITMVVGIVIGSGIFFTVDDILSAADYNIIIGFLALVVGAMAMIFGSIVFGTIASKTNKTGGIVSYMEVTYGKRASYCIGIFQATIFIPAITSILSWVSARYFLMLFGFSAEVTDNSFWVWILAIFLLISFYLFNYFKPLLSGKLHVPITFAPFIPLLFVGIVGTIVGIYRGTLVENFIIANEYFLNAATSNIINVLFATIVMTTFAYEGWTIATNIEEELKDSKKNLPRALFIGTIIVAIIYLIFYIGMVSFVNAYNMDDNSIIYVVTSILGNPLWSTVIIFFVLVSCLGTLNGLVLGSIRAPYLVASNGWGFKPKSLSKVNADGLSKNSAIYAFVCTLIMMIILFLNQNNGFSFLNRFGIYEINIIAFPIVVLYIGYVLIYIHVIRKFKDENKFKRFISPILALIGGFIILIGGLINLEILIGVIISFIFLLIAQKGYKKDNTF